MNNNNKVNICFIVSDVNESHQLNALFRGMKNFGYEVSLIFTGRSYPKIGELFAAEDYAVKFIECRGKKNFPKTLLKIYALLGEIKPNIVHTHLQTATLLGLTAAKLRGIRRRVYTRHHSIENYKYHPHAIFYDRYCNYLSARIIAISRSVEKILIEKENVNPARIEVVHHGFQFTHFAIEANAIIELKKKYNLNDYYPVIGAISRFVNWKGVQFIIPAFAEIIKKYPSAKLVLAGAKGDYASEIHALLAKYLKPENYVLIDFESCISELYKTFDAFVHVPVDTESEAFGQTYVEALALEIPSVFTLSGVAAEFIVDRKNALVVDFQNAPMIADAIETIITDKQLTEKIVAQGKADVENLFGIDKMVASLDRIYSDL